MSFYYLNNKLKSFNDKNVICESSSVAASTTSMENERNEKKSFNQTNCTTMATSECISFAFDCNDDDDTNDIEDENEFLERILFQGGGGLGDGVNVDSEQTQTTSGVPRQCNTVDADPG